jgi:hypothetical protein
MWPFGYSASQGLGAYSFLSSFGCRVMRSVFLSMAALAVLMSPAISADKQALLYKAPVRQLPLGIGPAATSAARPTAFGANRRNGLSGLKAALSPISRSAGMRWIAGAAARRPVATFNLPAAM